MGGGGVHNPVGQGVNADTEFIEGGDNVDQIAEVSSQAVNFPDDQGVARPEVLQAKVPLRAVDFGSGCDVCEGLQAAFERERVELQLRVLVRGADSGVSNFVAHRKNLSQTISTGFFC